ncbi:hypothetical protein LHYA1_G003645 [Lachnellula hyalina]|uniref:Uncharacterized protein n=1 Tax=Lachnellula hyalina TaxID=1316788 RepID=A0A8H8U0P2_9HELO|nr:uncharacterized protein LHYA1_G003645 [Lachnellula hyalina]TVY27535.1 hypothetical protein LHYA1_G003645 [Lachnellula hyalina]
MAGYSPQEAANETIRDAEALTGHALSLVTWETPKAAKEVRLQVETISRLGNSDLPTQRLLFRKVLKGFDERDYALAQARLQVTQLEARLEQLEPRKRRKVRTSPNSKFVDIQAIKEA